MNYEPFLKAIADFVGARGTAAEEGGVKRKAGHTHLDVERWLGDLPKPDTQIPLIHDYLRAQTALKHIADSGEAEVAGINQPVWEVNQRYLQGQVDADQRVQQALKDLYVGVNMPKDPAIRSEVMPDEKPSGVEGVSYEVSPETSDQPAAKPAKVRKPLLAEAKKAREDAWGELASGIEQQSNAQFETALERVRALHTDDVAAPGEDLGWKRAVNYMAEMEQQAQQWRAAGLKNEEWERAIEAFHERSGIDQVPLPQYVRTAINRTEAWADGQKPPSMWDKVGTAIGVARTAQTTADLSAPGQTAILLMGRPEYYAGLKPMLEAAHTPEGYAEAQGYIQNHPHLDYAEKGGLALTDVGGKLTHEESYQQAHVLEKIPVIGEVVRKSERAYNTFLNRVRMDTFSNEIRAAEALGVDLDQHFLESLAEWINTSTGRGGGKRFMPGPLLNAIFFSPRRVIARLQTFNPAYYAHMHPYVMKQALKSNATAAAMIFGLVSLAGMFGAKVTWDFRHPDAGKVVVGNTRIDLSGGSVTTLKLLAQLVTNEQINKKGEVEKLGSRFGMMNRLDKVSQFLMNKESPAASFVTDFLRGKDPTGKPFNLPDEVITRLVPMAWQDIVGVMKDKGVQSLLWSTPLAIAGIGLQTHEPRKGAETIPFHGVTGEVPAAAQEEYARLIIEGDMRATTRALIRSKGKSDRQAKTILQAYISAERAKVRREWIQTNRPAYGEAVKSGKLNQKIPLVAPQ